MITIRFSGRVPSPQEISIGMETDSNAEKIAFVLPKIADGQIATLQMILPDGVPDTLEIVQGEVTIPARIMEVQGTAQAWVEILADNVMAWHSGMITMGIGALPEISDRTEQQYPTAFQDAIAAVLGNKQAAETAAQEAEIAAAIAKSAQGQVTVTINGDGDLIVTYEDTEGETHNVNLGPVSAYSVAVKYGYQGTEEEWEQNVASVGVNAAAAAESAEDAADSAEAAATAKTAAQAAQEAAETAAERDVTAWLDEHVTSGETLVIDNTLTIEGAAAEAKVTGDELSSVKSALNSLVHTEYSKNLFNKSAVLENKYCNVNGVISDYNDRYVTDYIPVEAGKIVTPSFYNAATQVQTQSMYSAICCYDSTKAVVSGGNINQYTFTVPSGVAYVRITISASMYTYYGMVELTDDGVYTTYVPYHDPTMTLDEDVVVAQSNVAGLTAKLTQIDSDIDDNADAIDDFNDILSAGITFTQHGFIGSNGAFVSNENYLATDYINCVGNGTFIKYKYRLQVFSNTKIAYYDKSKTCISVLSPSSSGTLEYVEGVASYVEKAQYIRFCTYASAVGYYVKYSTVKNQFVGDDFLDTGITFTESGFIRYDGILIANSNYIATDYINCIAGGTFVPYKYRLKMFDNTKIAYYNENKQFISAISPSSSSTLEYVEGTVPYVDKAKYIRFCTAADSIGHYVKYASVKNQYVAGLPANPCDYSGNEISVFNRILCIGDSLTSGTFNYRVGDTTGNYVEYAKYSYPTYLKKLSGCDTVNMGNGGMSSAEWYAAHANDDLSGYDCAIIQLGVNDVIRYTTFGETSETAFNNIFAKLKTANKNIKIFVASIIPATSYHSSNYIAFSAAMSEFILGLNDQQIILLDMQQYGHTMDSTAFNCGHLSAYGYWRLAQDYKAYIGWYMNQNKTVFKEVQFIGTDYYYDPIT